jgi:hypothetical protein
VAADLQAHIIDTFRGEIPDFGDRAIAPGEALQRAAELLQRDLTSARDVALECALHRWDAATAFGVAHEIDGDLACDGIDEFFENAWPLWLDAVGRAAGNGERLRLARTDGPQRWHVVLDGRRPALTREDRAGDVEVAGTASDLLLWLWGRFDPPQYSGDRAVLERMRNPQGQYLSPGY